MELGPEMEVAAVGLSLWAIECSATSAYCTGVAYGYGSSEFWMAVSSTALEVASFGTSRYIGGTEGISEMTKTIGSAAADAVSPIYHTFGNLF